MYPRTWDPSMGMVKGSKTLILALVFGDKSTVFLDHISECIVLWCLSWACLCKKKLCLILKKKLRILLGRKCEQAKLTLLRLNATLIEEDRVRTIRCWNTAHPPAYVSCHIRPCAISWASHTSKISEELLCKNLKLLVKLNSSVFWRNSTGTY